MSFRTRLFVALAVAALLPLLVFMVGVRNGTARRLSQAAEGRSRVLLSILQGDLRRESGSITVRLEGIASLLAEDNRIRAATLRGDEGARRYELDYAARAMRSAGLALLVIHDSSGRIVSSGQFRNEYDRVAPALLALVPGAGGPWLVRARTATGTFLALATTSTARIGQRRFGLVGGIAADTAWLTRLGRDPELAVHLVLPGEPAPRGELAGAIPLAFVDLSRSGPPATARFMVVRRGMTLAALQRDTTLWFSLAVSAAALLALGVAAWAAERVSRPVRELATKTAAIDLDRLDQDFRSDRRDEIGALSNLLGAMTERLRTSAGRLRESERRATTGDLARQVNHDVKNGLVPIRHVVRHLAAVARQDPGALPRVFEERRETLESSVAYLDELARNYARLSPGAVRGCCDANGIVRDVLRDLSGRAPLLHELSNGLPPVRADATTLRRILENLVINAIESYDGAAPAPVTVTTSSHEDGGVVQVRIVVRDTGRGMSRPELDRAFDDFYTTKPSGTGLGLSVVRRLTADLAGALRVETEPGVGTRVVVDLPAGERG